MLSYFSLCVTEALEVGPAFAMCRGSKERIMALTLFSPAFGDDEEIPIDFSGEGADISPRLRWSEVPPGTREFALDRKSVV